MSINGIFEGADEVFVEERKANGERRYLNKCPGNHTLVITRNEVTRNGQYVAREFEVEASSTLRPGESVTDLVNMLPAGNTQERKWRRDKALKNMKAFTGAALNTSPNKVTQTKLAETVGDESPLIGARVQADVIPDKNPNFHTVVYRTAS